EDSYTWRPDDGRIPSNLSGSRSAIILAEEILRNRGRLTELDWRLFERLVAELLERDGFSVILTQGSRDGGIDVIADKTDTVLGAVRTIWQAKRFKEGRKVGLSTVRELSGLLDRSGSSKGFLVTTSTLTGGAINWIRQDRFLMDYREHDDIAKWVLGPLPTLG
ncbi:restriction endonuclease, partial [Allomesorhizobium camelthorni]